MNDAIEIKSFADFAKPSQPTVIVTYGFMDGTIPISETEAVDWKSFNPASFGSHVSMDTGANGPTVYITTPYAEVSEVSVSRYTPEFMNDQVNFNRYLILLRNSS